MGNTSSPIIWEIDAESLTRPGEKCVLSGPISGISPDGILDFVERHVRTRPLMADKYEASREVRDLPDGGIHEISRIEITGLANLVVGSIKLDLHAVYYFDKERDTLTMRMFHTDETLTSPFWVSVMRVLREPEFRIECLTDEFETRQAGPLLRNKVQRQFAAMGYSGECAYEVASPSSPGKKCVLTPEIPDAELTPELFWEKFGRLLEDAESGARLPDGSIVVEETGFFKDTSYLKYTFLPDQGVVLCQDYMGDDTLEQAKLSSFYKVVDHPKRVEVWVMTTNCKRSGGAQRDTARRLFEGALAVAAQA